MVLYNGIVKMPEFIMKWMCLVTTGPVREEHPLHYELRHFYYTVIENHFIFYVIKIAVIFLRNGKLKPSLN